VLERGLGRTICREFYFPYARKIWGLEPDDLAAEQAQRRVSAGSLAKLVRRLLPGAGGAAGGAARRGTFFYPRGGFGRISERIAEAALEEGARLHLETSVERVRVEPAGSFELEIKTPSGAQRLAADHVWSTIPVGALARRLDPAPPAAVLDAAARLELRAMLLVYLVLGTQRFSEYDAHYFPGPEVPFTRLSEPKNYAALEEPRGRTVLCAELPCAPSDPVFSLGDAALGELVIDGLARAGLPVRAPLLEVAVRRLPAAYPIYRRGFEAHFAALDAALDAVPGLLTFGRQGLFAHDNTHHALAMALGATDCLSDDGAFDHGEWHRYRRIFASHVVED
jgi:protoporphyrinogen oxidase